MARASSQLRDQLLGDIGAPLDFPGVRAAFGSSAAAADALGLRRPPRDADAERKARMVRERKTFQQSWSRWSRGVRRPTGGSWDRLRSAGERREIVNQVRRWGLEIESWHGEVDVYGSDVRDRDIDEVVTLTPADLEAAKGPAGFNFFESVERNDWTEAARAVATAWFAAYVGNDLAGGDAAWGEGELIARIPRGNTNQ